MLLLNCVIFALFLIVSNASIQTPQIGKNVLKFINGEGDDVGDPLILTSLINSGRIEEARQLSLVTNLTEVVSYSGYFTVNSTYNSNMFFWYFPAVVFKFKAEKVPVLVWLQGGPGGSSLFGLFTENGPFVIDSKMEVFLRSTSWSFTHHLVYFDNPVGTGFSFTDDDQGYARSEDQVGRDLYTALTQFLRLFPSLQNKELFVAGESYAGKYVPAICHRIHSENQKIPKIKINLKGMAIGDGLTDPVNMLNYGNYLYNLGLLNLNQKEYFEKEEEKARQFIRAKDYMGAYKVMDNLILRQKRDARGGPSYFKNCTGFDSFYNILRTEEPEDSKYFAKFVQLPYIRKAIHVGNQNFSDIGSVNKVGMFLRDDFFQSCENLVVDLLDAQEKYHILFYNGQLDIIVANILTEKFLKNMKWHGSDKWTDAEKRIWRVGDDIAGYSTQVDNLGYVLVRNAGHMVPTDQPKWAYDLINRFTRGKPFA